MAKLGEVCEVLDSKRVPITAANRVSGQYPYYGANGVQDYVADYILMMNWFFWLKTAAILGQKKSR